ncbi:DEAD/DEAH box helicase [Heliobacterium chlorum]|uniref:DEAD/DEAH box helicase n=1 Tax=Heliobacterium chlorum TaxID=2698 RepID=A0ABR7T0I6_HELCL|nr:DEAD/DEAH box helicase [Heliobacterium chlorum]MBC9784310.1 DEAD/DEAH box helicase [Heliobacterium chlorum]
MLPHDDERLEVANTIRQLIASEENLTPVQARSFVRCLQNSWNVPMIKWGEDESFGQLNDARRLIHAAEIYRQLEGYSSPNALLCYRRAGELLEWLMRAKDQISTIAPIALFAAGAYQLGGLPAMASSLLVQAEVRESGAQLYSSFLKADFDGVIKNVAMFWSENQELTNYSQGKRLLDNENDDNISWYFTVELVRSLGLIADSLRHGDDQRLEKALDKLYALDKLAVRVFSDDVSLLITLLCNVAIEYNESSIYKPIKQITQSSERHQKRLFTFARRQFKRRRGILWSSQRQGLNRLLNSSSFALCTPTGSGKTLVATFAIIKELLLKDEVVPAPLGLYLVPSRALATEVEDKLTNEFGKDLVITGLYGGTDWGITDYWLAADQPTVLIATVEKADALMRFLCPFLVARLRLLILDEAHLVVPEDNENSRRSFADHTNRSIKLEAFVSRLLMLSPSISRIALTAVAGGASLPVAKWTEGRQDAEAIGTNYRSTRQLVGKLEVSTDSSGRMLLELMNGQPLYVRGRNEPVYIPLRLPRMPNLPATMRNSIYRFTELSVLWTALHLVGEKRRILISIAQEPEQTMGWYKDAFELNGWENINFKPPKDEVLLAKYIETLEACKDYCGINSYEYFLLKRGIASNHGQMPQRLRRLMINLIDLRICPITVATATLTEGVNLPFDIIFLTSLTRRSYDFSINKQIITPLSVSEFNNLAGRAGRPGTTNGMEGMTLIAVPQKPSTTAPAQIPNQVKQIVNLNRVYDTLINNLQNPKMVREETNSPLALLLDTIAKLVEKLYGKTSGEFLEWLDTIAPDEISQEAGTGMSSPEARLADCIDELDGILISALEEIRQVESRDLRGSEIEAFLAKLWKKTFSSVASIQEIWLEKAFIRRGRAAIEVVYPDADERRRLYQYGFPPYLGRRFEQVVPRIRKVIENASNYGTMSENERIVVFDSLGDIISNDRGFGFRAPRTVTDQILLKNWKNVLSWWMNVENVKGPEPQELRAWQRFVVDNFEFRLGITIGAVVAYSWSSGSSAPLQIPSLNLWREITGLPWFGFWVRELLRWGTLEPFVAFALSQGLSHTRSEALELRSEYETWLKNLYGGLDAESFINPQLFLEWRRSRPKRDSSRVDNISVKAKLTGTNGRRVRYNVIPIEVENTIQWIDASGYELARSQAQIDMMGTSDVPSDYVLQVKNGKATVRKYIVY